MNKNLNLIKELLSDLNPDHLEIKDDSHKHSNHYKANDSDIYPSHITIIIASEKFRDLNLLQRQRLVNSYLNEAFYSGLHAASMKLYLPEELYIVNLIEV